MRWCTTKNNRFQSFLLQIPIVLLAPGKQPVTVEEKRACSSSGFTQVFSSADHHMDLPCFPIVLVSNGIHHIIPTVLTKVKKLIDWRLGLSLFHLNQSRKLFEEAQVEMLLEKDPDGEFVEVQTGLFTQLHATAKKLLETRAKKATGISSITSQNTLTGDLHQVQGTAFSYKGTLKSFPVPHPQGSDPGLTSDKEDSAITGEAPPITHSTATATTTGATASTEGVRISQAPPLPSLHRTSFSSPLTIGSSDSELGSPAPVLMGGTPLPSLQSNQVVPSASTSTTSDFPVPTSNPIPNSQVVTISTGYNKGTVTGKKRIKKYQIVSTPTSQKRHLKCSYPGCKEKMT